MARKRCLKEVWQCPTNVCLPYGDLIAALEQQMNQRGWLGLRAAIRPPVGANLKPHPTATIPMANAYGQATRPGETSLPE